MEQIIRKVTYTKEFEDYFQTLSNDVKGKYDYVFQIMLTQKIVSKKFVKRIETTEFYEMREYHLAITNTVLSYLLLMLKTLWKVTRLYY
ncbi:hypothetical protein LPYR103PRE_14880 [Segatella asaccharophila]|jgi:hypothetical protein